MSTQSLIPSNFERFDWSTNEPETIIPKVDILAAILINFVAYQREFIQELDILLKDDHTDRYKETTRDIQALRKGLKEKQEHRHRVLSNGEISLADTYGREVETLEARIESLQTKIDTETKNRRIQMLKGTYQGGIDQAVRAFLSVFARRKEKREITHEDREVREVFTFSCDVATRIRAYTIRVAVRHTVYKDTEPTAEEFDEAAQQALNNQNVSPDNPMYELRIAENVRFMGNAMRGLMATINHSHGITDATEKQGAMLFIKKLGFPQKQAAALLLQREQIEKAINVFEEATIETITTY
jgi:hypothetical protein